MPYDSGTRIPGGYTFADSTGALSPLTTAETPYAATRFDELQRRQEQSAPLAMGGGRRAPLVLSDAPLDLSAPSLPPSKGVSVGFGQSGFVPDAAPPVAIPTTAPLRIESGPEAAPKIDSGPSLRGFDFAPPPVAPGAAPKVDASDLVANPNGGGMAPGKSATRTGYDDAADLHRQAAMWELSHPSGGGGGPRPGVYETGRDTKVTTEGGKDPARVSAMSEQVMEQRLAEQRLTDAQREHAGHVAGEMEPFQEQWAQREREMRARQQEALDGLQARRAQAEQEAADFSVDPDRFWSDKSAGQKALFLIASAIAGGLNGFAGRQGNEVLTAVNKRIDEDIKEQQRRGAMLQARPSELGRQADQLRQHYGDERLAFNELKANRLLALEKAVLKRTQDTGNQVAIAQGEKFAADLAAEREKIWFDTAGSVKEEIVKKFKVVTPGASGTGGGKNPFLKAAEQLDKAGDAEAAGKKMSAEAKASTKGTQRVVVGGTTYEMPHSGTEEGGQIRKKLGLAEMGEKALARIEKRFSGSTFEKFSTTASAAQKNDVADLTEILSVMKDQGMVKDPDINRKMEALLSVRSGAETIESTRALIRDARASALKQGGAVPVKE